MSGGKSYGLLLEPLRHIANPNFGGIIFRRTNVQIKIEGGLWDTSAKIYPLCHARGFTQGLEWRFPSGCSISMAGMEHEKDKLNYQGAQIPYIAFDELCHFSKGQFFYMFGRNRSDSGISGYIRAACNPDPDSFVRDLIRWWINEETGYPIMHRCGQIRWFARVGDELQWAFNPETLKKKFGPETEPKSLTFIAASIYDNKIMLERDPGYLANLKALPYVEQEQLLKGNWNVRPQAGSYYRAYWFGEPVEAAPVDVVNRVRFWDRAATEQREGNNPDQTVGLLLSKDARGTYYIEDVRTMFANPFDVESAMISTAKQDGSATLIGYMQDPGSAGVFEAQQTVRKLEGFSVVYAPASGSKEVLAKPVSSQARAGNIKLVRGSWNAPFLRELENFPPPSGGHDDQVDALSGAFEMIAKGREIFVA